MKEPFLIFDMDQTLVDTKNVEPYRTNHIGRIFLKQNFLIMPTNLYSQSLVDICQKYHANNRVVVVSAAPEEEVRLFLRKHRFPNIPVYGRADKPIEPRLENICKTYGADVDEALVIGDNPRDILMAHESDIASIGVSWGEADYREELEKLLEKADPNVILDDPDELVDQIKRFEREEFGHEPRRISNAYVQLDYASITRSPSIAGLVSLGAYDAGNKNQFEKRILNFKSARYCFFEQSKYERICYFWDGNINQKETYFSTFDSVIEDVRRKVDSMPLSGKTQVIAAPNSLPEFSYRLDMNKTVAYNINRTNEGINTMRIVARLHPKKRAHTGSRTTMQVQFDTIGFYANSEVFKADNIVIFDDIRRDGVQTDSVAIGLRELNYTGDIYVLTLGHVKR